VIDFSKAAQEKLFSTTPVTSYKFTGLVKVFLKWLSGGVNPGCLLIHGFTATPDCLKSLKRPFEQAGWRVGTPLLAGHGSESSALDTVLRQDWFCGVRLGLEELISQTDLVCVAGLSLGGLMALRLAEAFPEKVRAIACLATPLFFRKPLVRVGVKVLRWMPFRSRYHHHMIQKKDPAAIRDPEAQRQFVGYDRFSLKSLFEVWDEMRAARRHLPRIYQPALIVSSRHDEVVAPKSARFMKRHLGSSLIEEVVLTNSNHVLTMDYEKDLVSTRVFEFFSKQIHLKG